MNDGIRLKIFNVVFCPVIKKFVKEKECKRMCRGFDDDNYAGYLGQMTCNGLSNGSCEAHGVSIGVLNESLKMEVERVTAIAKRLE